MNKFESNSYPHDYRRTLAIAAWMMLLRSNPRKMLANVQQDKGMQLNRHWALLVLHSRTGAMRDKKGMNFDFIQSTCVLCM